jgi:hypothetical protein
MSYVRFGEDGSQVYVFGTLEGRIECCWCALAPEDSREPVTVADEAALLAHLLDHRAAGHVVPDWLIRKLPSAPTPSEGR